MKSSKSFVCAMIALILTIIIFIVMKQFRITRDPEMAKLSAILSIGLFVISVTGAIFSLVGIKEHHSPKKVIGMLVNFALVFMYIGVGLVALTRFAMK